MEPLLTLLPDERWWGERRPQGAEVLSRDSPVTIQETEGDMEKDSPLADQELEDVHKEYSSKTREIVARL